VLRVFADRKEVESHATIDVNTVQPAFQNPQLLCDLVQVETELLIRAAERVLERNQKKPSQSVTSEEALLCESLIS
jgi:hypothetical protein